MVTVDSTLASWLKTDALFAEGVVANAVAAWGDSALDSSVISPLVFQADAQAEATAQAAFLRGPTAQDKMIVKGDRKDLIGRVVTIKGDRLGYEGAGSVAFVISAAEGDTVGTTTLTVLKRLFV